MRTQLDEIHAAVWLDDGQSVKGNNGSQATDLEFVLNRFLETVQTAYSSFPRASSHFSVLQNLEQLAISQAAETIPFVSEHAMNSGENLEEVGAWVSADYRKCAPSPSTYTSTNFSSSGSGLWV